MICVARDERYKRPPTWRRTPWGLCLLKCTPGKRPKRCIVCAGRARCHLCGFDAASRSTDQGTSYFRSRGAVGARYAVTSICPIVARSAEWDKSGTNEDGDFSCKRCWPCGRETREVLGCMAQEPFVRIPAPKARTTVSTAQAGRARNRCLDTPGACHWDT
jgi:hypothetical protein